MWYVKLAITAAVGPWPWGRGRGAVAVAVAVIGRVIVAALVSRNDTVSVIDAVDDQGSISFVSTRWLRDEDDEV